MSCAGTLAMRVARIACLLPVLSIVTPTAYGLECGDVITVDTVLTADLGPCPGNGIVIGREGVTLSLNGRRIIGTGAAVGVLLSFPNFSGPATIQGPGVIGYFDKGISVDRISNVTIRGVTLLANAQQIGVYQSGADLIANNDILGHGQGAVGIHLSQSSSVTIQQNTITGHRSNGIEGVFTGLIFVIDNNIRNNRVGIYTGIEPGFWTIQENNVSFNQEDGMIVENCKLIEGNRANQNGGAGILIGRMPRGSCPVRENAANHNDSYGIALVGGSEFRITGNQTLHNGVDLFWDGTGTGNCWSDNLFKTSVPAVLPQCY